jgi:CRISPR/Cas system-associated endonuclease/helicase Cas3
MNDLAQRQQALDISQSFIIQAPAGSGKTELLTQRYLKLLASCEVPENIIAMTFTLLSKCNYKAAIASPYSSSSIINNACPAASL